MSKLAQLVSDADTEMLFINEGERPLRDLVTVGKLQEEMADNDD